MKVLTKLSLLLLFMSTYSHVLAQEDINNEAFTLNFSPNDKGADLIYLGKSHSFSLNIISPSVKQQQVQGAQENQCFMEIGKEVVQTSLVPLPQPIPDGMHLSNLTVDEIKETLEGYVNYELDYMDKDLHLNPVNLKKEWKTINSKMYLVWYFEFKAPNSDAAKKFSAQVYYSTICFNQVLDINIPIFDVNELDPAKTLIESLAATLKTYDKVK